MILSAIGVLVAAGSAAAAILLPSSRVRSASMLLALALFPLLILGDQWHSPQIVDLRNHSIRLVALALAGLVAISILTVAFHRWSALLPLAIVAALPFRVPLHAGGDTANLLVPLYLVIAGGVLSAVLGEWQEGGGSQADAASCFSPWQLGERQQPPGEKPSTRLGPPSLLPLVLAVVVVLYALQTLYSPDFSKSLQNVCFFFVPFSLLYALLRDVRWDKKLLVLVLWVVAIEAVAFVLVGSVEYFSRSLFWNDQVIRSNEFHTYFRVNSIFWDPNIYGRYLALVIVVAMSALLWAKERRTLALLTGLVAVLWLGLVPTFSQSSFAALLAGLAVLAALRWSWRWTLGAVGAVGLLALVVVVFAGGTSKISISRLNVDTGGRANLVSGGTDLFAQRPIWGYGAGSFPRAYREHAATKKAPVSVSHTEPVTVAAEQGLIGLAAYAALLIAALWTMAAGLGSRGEGGGSLPGAASRSSPHPPGERDEPPGEKPSARQGPPTLPPQAIARAAVLATFIALLVHTMAYAGFYEDPITWVLLAAGASLAAVPVRPSA
ncbi:MAG TPA: O-antigen ligase family protein [Solirubrobacterales bacterium]|nr:O-antigen ligase family protein [Solirubrobacterales bacterium]